MSKANEPAYPADKSVNHYPGPTNREKLAMEIYARLVCVVHPDLLKRDFDVIADEALRAADIFFEQLNK